MLQTIDAVLNQQDRLNFLQRYDILDTPQEEAFDRVTRLVRQVFDVPMSTITFLDDHRQWSRLRRSAVAGECDIGPALCAAAFPQDEPLFIPDTLADPRFATNPLVIGDPHIRFYAGVKLSSPDGQNIGTLCAADTKPRDVSGGQATALTDLAKIIMSELELRLLATTDGLTSVLSRRAFHEEASRAVALALRHRYDLSVIVFDLDHFKRINDTHGHATGDIVLRETVAACSALLRKSDLVGRIGGEEFAILLPHTKVAAAMEVADKLRTAIARQRLNALSGPFAVSASFGVTGLDRTTTEIDSLLQRADSALYEAKADGRNRCVAWKAVEVVKPSIRRRVFKAGRISFNTGQSCIDCIVRTLSNTGAGVDVVSSADIPDIVKLQIEVDGFWGQCRIVRKTERHLELEFY